MAGKTGQYWQRRAPLLSMAAISFLMGGCATAYNVEVDALRNPDAVPLGHSYEIVAANPSTSPNSAQFQQARQLVRKALTSVGMYEVPEGEPPDMTIAIDFGVGMRQVAPVTQNANSPFNSGIGPIVSVPGVPMASPTTGTSGYSTYNFRKYLIIVASIGGPGTLGTNEEVELWRVETALVDRGDNMEYYLPILAGVASEFVATDTHEKTTRHVSQNDEVVVWVQQGL